MKRWAIGLVVLFSLSCGLVTPAADFDGDGYDDLAVFRPSSGLWAVRDMTRFYFGSMGDIPAPGNYIGSAAAEAAIFRPATGLWAIQGLTRSYFGNDEDVPLTGVGSRHLSMKTIEDAAGFYTLNPQYQFYEIIYNRGLDHVYVSIGNGATPGQLLVIAVKPGQGGLFDIVILDTGNAKLAGVWSAQPNDSITLIWDGNYWIETSRSEN